MEIIKSEIKKILIKIPNWLGDSVMSVPAVAGVKKLFPDAEVWILAKKGLSGFWRLVPDVTNVIESVPKRHNFDLGILLTNSFGSAFRMYLSGIPERIGYSVNWRRFLLTGLVRLKKKCGEMHQTDYFIGIAEGLGRFEFDRIPRIYISNELKDKAKGILIANGWDGKSKIIGLHATASYGPAKCWFPERFSRLIDRLVEVYDTWIVMVGSSGERDAIEKILKGAEKTDKVINLAGRTDIDLLSGIIKHCDIFIANDSGPMHLAASVGTRVIAIFGSTNPAHTGPRGSNCTVVKKQVSCSPCFKRVCPRNLECMDLITVDDIVSLFKPSGLNSDTIAVVMKDYDAKKGGAEGYLAEMIKRISHECKSVDLIVNRVKGDIPSWINLKKTEVSTRSSILYPLMFNRAVRKILKANKYNIVYGLTQIYPQDVYRAGGGLEHSWFDKRYPKIRQKVFNYIRPKNLVRLFMEDRIFTRGNYKKIITNSNLCKYQILHHYRVSPEDIKVIYNGVDRNRFNPGTRDLYRENVREQLGIKKDSRVILFISNNWKRKGLAELIKAVSILGEKDIILIIAGRGRKERYVRLGLEGRIRFIGQTNEPERYYGACDIFVLPTYYDPCANVCIEALACGLPVVTTRMNGASEFIIEGRNGFVAEEPSDIKALADSIKKAFLIDRNDIEKTISRLTLENNIKETMAVLKKINVSVRTDIYVNNGYREILNSRGWLNFDNVMRETGGILYKKNKLRSVVKIDIDGKNLFLKRHFKRANPSWAFREWQNIFRLKSLGIKTMNPAAVGERGGNSFIITESLEDAEKLENLIKKSRLDFGERRDLILKLSVLTKRLHNNNLFHKDFYTGHIFVKKTENGFEPFLIDVQRLERHLLFTRRWRIKDIASLSFSSFGGCVNVSDRFRFLKYYLDADDIREHRDFIKEIIEKTGRIERHTKKLLERRKGL